MKKIKYKGLLALCSRFNQNAVFLIACFLINITAFAQTPISDRIPLANSQRIIFYNYLVDLQRGSLEVLPLAVDEYERLFSKSDPVLCDSAFVILEDFAMTVLDDIEFNYPLLKTSQMPRSAEEKRTGEKYLELLLKNYYIVHSTSSDIVVTPDFKAIRKRINKYFSPATKLFFEYTDSETAYQNGDICIKDLAQRVCLWDDFARLYPSCIYAKEAIQRRDAYLESLIFGVDDSGICDKKRKVKDDVLEAYKYLLGHTEKDAKINEIISKYVKILKANKYNCNAPAVLGFTYDLK